MAKRKYIRIERKIFNLALFFLFLASLIFAATIYEYKISKTPYSSSFALDEISPQELNNKLTNKNFTLINVHTPYEGEIEKTDLFIEYDSMKASENILPKDKNTELILYCESGNMSKEAVLTLQSMGYTNVSHLEGGMKAWRKKDFSILDLSSLPEQVLPEQGFELPLSWGHIGPQLDDVGAIDSAEFEKVVKMTDDEKKVLAQETEIPIKITSQNGQFVVDILWAFGLAQKSKVYDEGPLGKEQKGNVGNFASTGGWTLAKGDVVNHLNKHDLIALSQEQQDKVSEIAKNVYRPCCGNSTFFPDCNHGMAALAAIELMVAKGISDEEIYKNLLKLNSFWFPDHYLTLATYFARQGTSWDKIDAKLALGQDYSSGQAASKLYEKVGPLPYEGQAGGSCGA